MTVTDDSQEPNGIEPRHCDWLEHPSDDMLRKFSTNGIEDVTLRMRIRSHLTTCGDCLRKLDETSTWTHSSETPGAQQLHREGRERLANGTTLSVERAQSESSQPHQPILSLKENAASQLPDRIGSYFIVKKLGEGSFSVVYLAKNQGGTLCAIKVFKGSSVNSPEVRERVLREARMIARLEHRNIVSLRSCIELDSRELVLEMDYHEGGTLASLMRSRRLSVNESIRLAAQIADGLAYAHRLLIWHRDLKPANILIDKDGNPLIADFGLALHREEQHECKHQFAGTLRYMAPEQLAAKSEHLDGRCDIWALGVILYRMLTNRLPFDDESTKNVRSQISDRDPLSVQFHDPEIPDALEKICVKCLRKDPSDRYGTAELLAKDLHAFLDHHSRVGRLLPSDGAWRRNASVVAALTAVVVAAMSLVFGLGSGETQDKQGGQARPSLSLRPASPSGDGDSGSVEAAASRQVRAGSNWIDLLAEEPTALSWINTPTSVLAYDAKSRKLTTSQIGNLGMLSCYSTDKAEFRIRWQAQCDRSGGFGVFWGARQDEQGFANRSKRCWVLSVSRSEDMNQAMRSRFVAVVQQGVLAPAPWNSESYHCEERLSPTWRGVFESDRPILSCELFVERGRFGRLVVDGNAVVAMASPTTGELTEGDANSRGTAELGLVSTNGVVTFQQAGFLNLESE